LWLCKILKYILIFFTVENTYRPPIQQAVENEGYSSPSRPYAKPSQKPTYEEPPQESQPAKYVPPIATSYSSSENDKPNVSANYSPLPLAITPADISKIPPGFCYCALYKALTTAEPTTQAETKPLYTVSEPEVTSATYSPPKPKYKEPSTDYKPPEAINPKDSYSGPPKPKYSKPSSEHNPPLSNLHQDSYSNPPKPQYNKPKSEDKPSEVTELQDLYASPPNPQYRTPVPETRNKTPLESVTLSGFLAKNQY